MRPTNHDHHMNRRPISVTNCGKASAERLVVIHTMTQRADGSRFANPHIAESVLSLESHDHSYQLTTLLIAQAAGADGIREKDAVVAGAACPRIAGV
jgi:hypothetical protein